MRNIVLISILLVSLSARAQSQCEKLDDKLSVWQEKHHKALAEMRYLRDEPKYAESYLHTSISDELYDNSYSYSDVSAFEDCGRIVDLDLAYDEYSHHRVLQLLKNEFEEGELDTLVKRHTSIYVRRREREELWERYREPKIVESILNDKNGPVYRSFIDSLTEARMSVEREMLLNTYNFDIGSIIDLAGCIDNEGIEDQLEKMLNDTLLSEFRDRLTLALVRHNVEPYYTRFIQDNKYDRSKDAESLLGQVYKLLRYTPCQQTILLTKDYLMDEQYYVSTTADGTDPYDWYVRKETYDLLTLYLKNSGFLQLCEKHKDKKNLTKDECKQLIKWLKANYGKYEIRRFW